MPVRLHHIVVDAHDLPGLARFWTQAPGWKVLSERENEIVIGTDENAPVDMCFMPVADPKTVKNRAAGQPPKLIDEYAGRASTGQESLSIAHMRSRSGWAETGQCPEFDEFTIVLRGTLLVAPRPSQSACPHSP
jgi:hypothetical protein